MLLLLLFTSLFSLIFLCDVCIGFELSLHKMQSDSRFRDTKIFFDKKCEARKKKKKINDQSKTYLHT